MRVSDSASDDLAIEAAQRAWEKRYGNRMSEKVEDSADADGIGALAISAAREALSAYHQARRIETVEQLDALSNYSVVLGHTTAYQLDGDNNLSGLYGPWMPTGSEVPVWSDEIPLPCALLWTPGGGE